MPPPPKHSHRIEPGKPQCRRTRRAHTILFWAVFVLFLGGLCYLGLLAFIPRSEHLISITVDSHRLAECLVALAAIGAVIAGIATYHHQ